MVALSVAVAVAALAQKDVLRPPAVPLVACDPYFSIWSRGDNLAGQATTHWTGSQQRIVSLVGIDGVRYRLMGAALGTQEEAMPQTSVQVLPTRTIYKFAGHGVGITLTFMTPALPNDLDLLSRPVTYLTWDVKATDGKSHQVYLAYGNTGDPAVDQLTQVVRWEKVSVAGLSGYKVGTAAQPVLQKTGDDRRIDWGYMYSAAPAPWKAMTDPKDGPAGSAEVGWLVTPSEEVRSKTVSHWVELAYDEIYGVQYFTENLRPYWRRNGMDATTLLTTSASEYASLVKRCEAFDGELMADLRKSGGERYATLCALAYRQTWAGSGLVADRNGQPLFFPKENSSNGCIGTVDIIFPMAPQVLLFGPSITKAMLVSNLDYASSSYWKWPFAPHDLGQYPKANGQVYGGGERTEDGQMPVEESGNMLILTLALAQMEGNAKFAEKYWPQLTRWADYLKNEGFDPGNQLSTDDFMGPLAHQTNLSIKATIGLASYARLAQLLGKTDVAKSYGDTAKSFAADWVKSADDGDHFRLAFDQPGTWGQKYNLVWDKILGLGLYPDAVRKKEMAFYLANKSPYGVALDSRRNASQTKTDWSMWTATLTGDPKDFEAVQDGVWRFLNESRERVPLSDWYNVKDGRDIGFIARPVVGGLFIKTLYDKALWKKWAGRDEEKSANWAPLPIRPTVQQVVPTAEAEAAAWMYTTERPAADWFSSTFDDAAWRTGRGGFGGNIPRSTPWNSADIWTRRAFSFSGSTEGLYLRIFHDENADVYLNGTKITTLEGYTTSYDDIPVEGAMLAALKQGKNVLAVHVHQTVGGQGFDAGFVRLVRK